jgi:hypothetical protein
MELPTTPKIFAAVNAVMKEIGPIAKDRKNTQQGYSFRGVDDLMNAISPVLSKYGIFPTCTEIESILDENITSKNGGAGYRQIRRFNFRFFSADGSFVDTLADGEAIDYGDKGSNKAQSVAYREAMFKMFVIPFENDDIENADHDLKAPQPRQAAPQRTKPTETRKDPSMELLAQKDRVVSLLKQLGFKPVGKTVAEKRAEVAEAVFKHANAELTDTNLEAIAEILSAKIESLEAVADQ